MAEYFVLKGGTVETIGLLCDRYCTITDKKCLCQRKKCNFSILAGRAATKHQTDRIPFDWSF